MEIIREEGEYEHLKETERSFLEKDKEVYIKIKIVDPVLADWIMVALYAPINIKGFDNLGIAVEAITRELITKSDMKELLMKTIQKIDQL